MGRPGWSEKPCPGCGSEDGRPTGEVCHECSALLEDGRRYREHVQALRDDGELEVYRWERTVHWNEPFLEASRCRRALEEAFHAVVMAIVRTELPDRTAHLTMPDQRRAFLDADRLIPWQGRGFSRFEGGQSFVAAHPEEREVLVRLSAEIRAALRATFAAGHEQGRSLLLKLAAGEKTEADVEEAAAWVVEAAQEARAKAEEVDRA